MAKMVNEGDDTVKQLRLSFVEQNLIVSPLLLMRLTGRVLPMRLLLTAPLTLALGACG